MLKKAVLFTCIMALLVMGCEDKDDSFNVSIRVSNKSEITLNEVLISGYAPELRYLDIIPGSITEYQKLESDMRPDVFYLRTATDTMHVVYDYIPEFYDMEDGFYTLEVDSEFNFNYLEE